MFSLKQNTFLKELFLLPSPPHCFHIHLSPGPCLRLSLRRSVTSVKAHTHTHTHKWSRCCRCTDDNQPTRRCARSFSLCDKEAVAVCLSCIHTYRHTYSAAMNVLIRGYCVAILCRTIHHSPRCVFLMRWKERASVVCAFTPLLLASCR